MPTVRITYWTDDVPAWCPSSRRIVARDRLPAEVVVASFSGERRRFVGTLSRVYGMARAR